MSSNYKSYLIIYDDFNCLALLARVIILASGLFVYNIILWPALFIPVFITVEFNVSNLLWENKLAFCFFSIVF
jgi:hypothetical protein